MTLPVMTLRAMQEIWVQSLGQEDALEKGMATHSSILASRIPKTEEPGGLQSIALQRAGLTEPLTQQLLIWFSWHTPFSIWIRFSDGSWNFILKSPGSSGSMLIRVIFITKICSGQWMEFPFSSGKPGSWEQYGTTIKSACSGVGLPRVQTSLLPVTVYSVL